MASQIRGKEVDKAVSTDELSPFLIAFIIDRYLVENSYGNTHAVFHAEAADLFSKYKLEKTQKRLLGLAEILNQYIELKEQRLMLDQEKRRLKAALQRIQEAMSTYLSPPSASGPLMLQAATPAAVPFLAPPNPSFGSTLGNQLNPFLVTFFVERYLVENNYGNTHAAFHAEANDLFSKNNVKETQGRPLGLAEILNDYINLKEQRVLVDQEKRRFDVAVQGVQEAMRTYLSLPSASSPFVLQAASPVAVPFLAPTNPSFGSTPDQRKVKAPVLDDELEAQIEHNFSIEAPWRTHKELTVSRRLQTTRLGACVEAEGIGKLQVPTTGEALALMDAKCKKKAGEQSGGPVDNTSVKTPRLSLIVPPKPSSKKQPVPKRRRKGESSTPSVQIITRADGVHVNIPKDLLTFSDPMSAAAEHGKKENS